MSAGKSKAWLQQHPAVQSALHAAAVFGAIVLVFAVVWQVSQPLHAGHTTSRCPKQLERLKPKATVKAVTVATIAARREGKAATLTAVDAQGKPVQGNTVLRFTFGPERDPLIRRQTFQVPITASQATVQAALINDFVDTTTDRVLPTEKSQVRLGFQRTSAPGTVTLVTCIDPDGPGVMHPGDFVGAAALSLSKGPTTTIGLEVTSQDRRWWLVLAFAFAGGLAGILVKLQADKQSLDKTVEVSANPNRWSARTWVACAGGVTAAIYSFLTIYSSNPTFSAEFGTLWQVAAQTFAGTLAAKALTDLAGPPPGAKAPPPTPT